VTLVPSTLVMSIALRLVFASDHSATPARRASAAATSDAGDDAAAAAGGEARDVRRFRFARGLLLLRLLRQRVQRVDRALARGEDMSGDVRIARPHLVGRRVSRRALAARPRGRFRRSVRFAAAAAALGVRLRARLALEALLARGDPVGAAVRTALRGFLHRGLAFPRAGFERRAHERAVPSETRLLQRVQRIVDGAFRAFTRLGLLQTRGIARVDARLHRHGAAQLLQKRAVPFCVRVVPHPRASLVWHPRERESRCRPASCRRRKSAHL
jgi:hypothetical protein